MPYNSSKTIHVLQNNQTFHIIVVWMGCSEFIKDPLGLSFHFVTFVLCDLTFFKEDIGYYKTVE